MTGFVIGCLCGGVIGIVTGAICAAFALLAWFDATGRSDASLDGDLGQARAGSWYVDQAIHADPSKAGGSATS